MHRQYWWGVFAPPPRPLSRQQEPLQLQSTHSSQFYFLCSPATVSGAVYLRKVQATHALVLESTTLSPIITSLSLSQVSLLAKGESGHLNTYYLFCVCGFLLWWLFYVWLRLRLLFRHTLLIHPGSAVKNMHLSYHSTAMCIKKN